jgi:hypothetical protein
VLLLNSFPNLEPSTLSREFLNNVICIIFKLLLIMNVATPLQASKHMGFLSCIFHFSYKFLSEPATSSADAVSTFSHQSFGRANCLDPKMDFDFWEYIRYHSMSDITVCQISQYVRYHSMSDITVCRISQYVRYHSMSDITVYQISQYLNYLASFLTFCPSRTFSTA